MPLQNDIKKAALYVRLSREDRNKVNEEDDSESIINQQIMLLEYCQKHSYDVYKIYNDEDFRGSDRTRPAFNEMINDARDRKFDLILCKTQARFARDVELVEKYINTLFPIWGVRFLSIVDNADSENKSNRKARQINSLVDQWMLEDLSDNIKATLSAKRKQGLWVGAFTPYGYVKDPNDKNHLVIDEEAANVVRYVFDLYLHGYGTTGIARRLNDEHIPNPATYKKQHGQPFESIHKECSDLWHTYSIGRMISNQVYIGNVVQGMSENISYKSNKKRQKSVEEWDVVENCHEPIISRDIWDKVQQIRTGKPKPLNQGLPNIFAGKLRCLKCEGSMRTYYNNRARYFACHTKFFARERCEGTYVSTKVLEREVLKQIRELYQSLIDETNAAEDLEVENGYQDRLQWLSEMNESDQREIEKIKSRFSVYYADRVEGVITAEQFRSINEDCQSKIQSLEEAVQDRMKQIDDIQFNMNHTTDKLSVIKQFKDITELDYITVQTLIDHIEIGGNKNNRIINIYWNI